MPHACKNEAEWPPGIAPVNMIDTHAHLNEIEDIAEAIQAARKAGVKRIVSIGMDLASNKDTLSLAHELEGTVFPAIGYHPWSIVAEQIETNLAFIREHLPQCVALGEVGLDYRAKAKKKLQWEVFARLLALAAPGDLPVIIHSRFSHERTHRMVKDAGISKAVFHWYSGSLDVLERILEDGYCVSATPALAYSPQHRTAIELAPVERILMETDAPVEYQGKVTGPADLVLTLRELARIKQLEIEEVARITTSNAERFFHL